MKVWNFMFLVFDLVWAGTLQDCAHATSQPIIHSLNKFAVRENFRYSAPLV